jgi:hypothetical protein
MPLASRADASDNEDGFRIYRDQVLPAEVDPEATAYEDADLGANTSTTDVLEFFLDADDTVDSCKRRWGTAVRGVLAPTKMS